MRPPRGARGSAGVSWPAESEELCARVLEALHHLRTEDLDDAHLVVRVLATLDHPEYAVGESLQNFEFDLEGRKGVAHEALIERATAAGLGFLRPGEEGIEDRAHAGDGEDADAFEIEGVGGVVPAAVLFAHERRRGHAPSAKELEWCAGGWRARWSFPPGV